MTLIELPKEITPDVPTWVSSLNNPITINPQGVAVKEFTELPRELVGGNNLITHDREFYALENEYQIVVRTDLLRNGRPVFKATKKTSGTPPTTLGYQISIAPGESYTLSLDIMHEDGQVEPTANTGRIIFYDNGGRRTLAAGHASKTVTGWQRVSVQYTNNEAATIDNVSIYFYPAATPGNITYFSSPKLERGLNANTVYSPAPEDLGYTFPQWIQNGNPVQFNPEGVAFKEVVEIPSELTGGRNLVPDSHIGWWNATYERLGVGRYRLSGGTMGLAIHASIFKPTTDYVLSFKVKVLDGRIERIGGHSAYFRTNKIELDGVDIQTTGTWSTGVASFPDDKNVHEVRVYLTSLSVDASDNKLYIQPNRSTYTSPYSAEISDIKVEVGTVASAYSPSPEDLGYDLPHWIQNFDAPIQYHTEGVAVKEV